jgi:NhaP-type Na+/H+ or K+/H+ antiporter
MVVGLSFLINAAVFLDIENQISKCFRGTRSINLAEDDETMGSHARVYLDRKTQLILLFSGVRGAVSFALVENIPVWDAVTQVGSKYKAELKAMTSSSIVFTLFVFGALTYITVKQGNANGDGHIAGSALTHRLLSEPLDSDDENHSQSEPNSMSLEIEHPRPGLNQARDSYHLTNEWTE